jgi:hypothetical protein
VKNKLTIEGEAKNFFDSTFLIVGGSITRMNTSSSQRELVQSWGLGHSNPNGLQLLAQTHKFTYIEIGVGR